MADIQQTTNKQHRMLKISILRFNPQDPESVPHMQTYELEESDSMTLFIALNELRDTQDPTLQFDFVCRRHLRFLRHDDQRQAGSRLPYADA